MSLLRTSLAAIALGLAMPALAQDVIRIGAPLPITGPLSPEAVKQQRGYDLWAETANKAGGVRVGDRRMRVEIVYVDYQSNTPRAVQAAERLITQDKVNFLFSPFGSGAAKAASTVSEKYQVPTIAATASSAQVYDQGYKYLFGTFTPNDTLTEPLADIVKAQAPGVNRVAILARNDLFPLAIAQEMEKSAKARGMRVVYSEKYAIGTLDHASALTQIKAQAPHWIFATGYTNDLVLMRKQMADLKIEAPIVTMIAPPPTRSSSIRPARAQRTSPARPGGIRPCATREPTSSAPPRPMFRPSRRNTGLTPITARPRPPQQARSCRWPSRRRARLIGRRSATNWPISTSPRSGGR